MPVQKLLVDNIYLSPPEQAGKFFFHFENTKANRVRRVETHQDVNVAFWSEIGTQHRSKE